MVYDNPILCGKLGNADALAAKSSNLFSIFGGYFAPAVGLPIETASGSPTENANGVDVVFGGGAILQVVESVVVLNSVLVVCNVLLWNGANKRKHNKPMNADRLFHFCGAKGDKGVSGFSYCRTQDVAVSFIPDSSGVGYGIETLETGHRLPLFGNIEIRHAQLLSLRLFRAVWRYNATWPVFIIHKN